MPTATETIRLSDILIESSLALASDSMERLYARRPGLRERYGPRGVLKAVDDARENVRYLAEAVAANCPLLFQHYIGWLWPTIEPYGVSLDDLRLHLDTLESAALERLGSHPTELIRACFERAREVLVEHSVELPSLMPRSGPLAELARQYLEAVLGANRKIAITLILDAADAGVSMQDLYLRVLQPAQREVGRLWQRRQITVAQEHYATAIAQLVMSLLYPRIIRTPKNGCRLVAACVGSDLHEIGLRMVSDFFELAGWDAYYVGAAAPTPALLAALETRRPHLLAISTTLAIHLIDLRRLISAVRRSQFADLPILVGGYPFNQIEGLWQAYGADAYADSAELAVSVADALVTHRGGTP